MLEPYLKVDSVYISELVLEPNIKDDHGYIDFTYGRPKTYEKYVKRLDEIFKRKLKDNMLVGQRFNPFTAGVALMRPRK